MLRNNQLDSIPEGPVFVHSDALNTLRLVPRNRNITELAKSHIFNIQELTNGRSIWMPTFNYQFGRTHLYDVDRDKSEVGLISETFRQEVPWRTNTPVFNVAGTNEKPEIDEDLSELIQPFGINSIFSTLHRNQGSLLWYGAPIASATILHYVESIEGGPLYRYDKHFVGEIISSSIQTAVDVSFHVRPKDQYLEYDWPRIETDLFNEAIIKRIQLDQPADIFIAEVNHLVEFWKYQLQLDPLYFLDQVSRKWVEPHLEKLGRRFNIEDFEATKNE